MGYSRVAFADGKVSTADIALSMTTINPKDMAIRTVHLQGTFPITPPVVRDLIHRSQQERRFEMEAHESSGLNSAGATPMSTARFSVLICHTGDPDPTNRHVALHRVTLGLINAFALSISPCRPAHDERVPSSTNFCAEASPISLLPR